VCTVFFTFAAMFGCCVGSQGRLKGKVADAVECVWGEEFYGVLGCR
jgi:hypothetical protein